MGENGMVWPWCRTRGVVVGGHGGKLAGLR
jgi:hypothetical protein